jgi:hypothetical protein
LPDIQYQKRIPLIEAAPAPKLHVDSGDPAGGWWSFQYPVYGSHDIQVELQSSEGRRLLSFPDVKGTIGVNPNIDNCDASNLCELNFLIHYRDLASLDDQMVFEFYTKGTGANDRIPIGFTKLFGLRTFIGTAFDECRHHVGYPPKGGQLVFDPSALRQGGAIADLECVDDDRTDCSVESVPTVKEPSYVYLYSPNLSFPLPLTQNGATDNFRYVTPEKPKPQTVATTKSDPNKAVTTGTGVTTTTTTTTTGK